MEYLLMAEKQTYEELEQKVKELEKESFELKQVEEELKHQKRRLESLIKYSSLAIVTLDEKHNIISCNRDFEKLFCFNESEIVGRNLDELIAGQKYIGDTISYTKDTLAGKTIRGSGKRQRKDGAYIDVEFIGVPVIIEGKVIGAYGIYQDISKRKQIEEALGESEEKYRSIVENIEEGYSEVDLAGNFTFFNDSISKILGYSKNELMGLNSRKYTDNENTKKLYEIFNRVYKTGKPSKVFGWEAIRKDGTKRYVEASVSLIRDAKNRPIGFRGIARDLTERELAKEALRREEERFKVLVEKSPLGVSLIGKDGHYEYLNPKFIEMFGYSLEDIPVGRDWFFKAYPDSKYRQEVISTWIDDLEKYETGESRPRSYKVSCKDGSKKVVYFRPVTMETGEQFLIYEDITEKIRLEAQLQQAQKMEAIGTLAGGVAHDLNNILSGIVSYPELILMDLPENSPLRKPILTIQKSGERAAVIVQDLLTLARRGVAISEVLNLNNIISEQLKSPEFEKLKSFHLNVQVETNLDKNLLNIKGSTTHLSKSVMNLVSNAAEAMPSGGKILISTENLYIDRPIRGYDHVEEGDYVTVMVSDTGIGISKEDMERIFEPFYTKKVMGRSGTGLGMAVVWGTVKDHKGYIDVESTEGEGTIFTLYFPVTREEIVPDKSLPSIEDYMGKGESILVVDDVKEQRELASNMLNKLHYSVNTVSSGENAIEYLGNNSVDLLVLDMIMEPGIDGLDTYKRIIEIHPNQKAIIASGYSETDRVKEAQRLGAGQYIKKPYTLGKIGLAIKKELEK
jgi:two-component system, cell cycle sensor histidine kinase and response regulator CckA